MSQTLNKSLGGMVSNANFSNVTENAVSFSHCQNSDGWGMLSTDFTLYGKDSCDSAPEYIIFRPLQYI